MPNEQLAVFGQEKFAEDREGISIYHTGEGTGYLVVSDQQANEFHLYPREGAEGNAHAHPL
ncbi:MAG TPA: 3-phytase, partial [Cytophagales bacterium]|nr:3-phytase [Cytophagales bacterium]